MKIWSAAFSILAALSGSALAQTTESGLPPTPGPPGTVSQYVSVCDAHTPSFCATIDSGGNLHISGTFSATLGGFTPTAIGAALTATTGGATGTLPAGTEVIAFNTGTANNAYCQLGATGSTSGINITPGNWFPFAITTQTQITCETTTGTTVVNLVGGSGLPTGTGGYGGSGGGGGTVLPSYGTGGVNGTSVNTTSALALAARSSGKFLSIKNESTSASVACNLGGTAALNSAGSFTMNPGASAVWSGFYIPLDAINCIASAAATPITIEAN